MKKIKKLSSIISIVFMLQFILSAFFTNTVQAAVDYPITFPKVENRPVKEAIRYKNKTIILDRYVDYYDKVVDQPIKLLIEEDGKKNIVSEDVQLLRGFIYIGIRDNFAFFVDTYNEGRYVYKVDLNNYTMQKTDERVFNYTKNVNIGVRDAVFDTEGNKWFSDQTGYWDFRDANGNLIENAGAFLLYNSLGKLTAYKISSRVITNYESVGHITPGNNGDVWFTYSYIKDRTLNTRDNKIIRVTKDGLLEEYPIDTNYYIDDIRVDKSGNVYLKGTNWVKEGYQMVKKEGMVMHYTFTNGKLQHLRNYPVESNYFTDMDLDVNENLWILYGAKPSKLENGNFNLKYYTYANMNELSVYDDNNMVTFCFDYGYTNITVKDTGTDNQNSGQTGGQTPSQPTDNNDGNTENNTNNNNENNTGNNNENSTGNNTENNTGSNSPSTDNKTPISDIISKDKISKDSVNELSPVIKNGSAEVKLDAEAVKGGQGILKLSVDSLSLELPFSAIDFTGIGQSSYVSIKESALSNDSILDNIKDIGKIFDFSLATYNADGTLIKDIHNFASGKAKISIKLTDEDIKNLDTTKLAAFYYNEGTKTWELIGGTFNKDTMVFTFETSHFSKYTIAQTSGVLPQTGSFVNTSNLIMLSFILIGVGISLVLKKRVRE